MGRKVALAVMISLMLCSVTAWAGKKGNAPRLNGTWSNPTGSYGVFDDGIATYDDGIDGVQFYFGVDGRNINLITYDTPRNLVLNFDPSATPFQNSGLSSPSITSMVTLFGVNYYGQFASMGVGTTAQLQMDIEFKDGTNPLTFELTYPSIAAMRQSSGTWLITSDPFDICQGGPDNCAGFTPSDQTVLSVIKKHSQTVFGTVSMPVRFTVTLQ